MKVRMLQQVSGSRNGQPWPAPGEEVDLSDSEAHSVIGGGAAEEVGAEHDTVLVPPDGIHTPGMTAFQEPGVVNLVAVPTDALADPEGVRAALKARAEGNYAATAPAGTGLQQQSGAAMNAEGVERTVKAEETAREDLNVAPASKPATGKPANKR
jgi:hypothetical protein